MEMGFWILHTPTSVSISDIVELKNPSYNQVESDTSLRDTVNLGGLLNWTHLLDSPIRT